jgi:hypothetical protein
MSKSNKQRKEDARALTDARKLTWGKVLRLVLKSLLFAVVVAVLIEVLARLGVPVKTSIWYQYGLVFIVYIVAYPFLMSEFRVPRQKR